MTDPDPGSYGLIDIRFSDNATRLRASPCKAHPCDLDLPRNEPALQESLTCLFGGARSKRFATICCGPGTVMLGFDLELYHKVLQTLREVGFSGNLQLCTQPGDFDSPSGILGIAELIEQYVLPVSVGNVLVSCRNTRETSITSCHEQAWLRLAGLPNLAWVETLIVPYFPNRGYSFLVPLANRCDLMVISRDNFPGGSFAPLSSLTNLRGLRFFPALESPEDVSPLSALVSLTQLFVEDIMPSTSCWEAFSNAVSELPLQSLSLYLKDDKVPGPNLLSRLGPLALPESVARLKLSMLHHVSGPNPLWTSLGSCRRSNTWNLSFMAVLMSAARCGSAPPSEPWREPSSL